MTSDASGGVGLSEPSAEPPAAGPAPAGPSSAGLRERKKAKTRGTIRNVAMRLFTEQGYAATTVEQIAEAAEVSPSTFFRYFPTKEDVVLTDDYDPLVVAAIRAQPPGTPVIEAVLLGMRQVFERLTEAEWTSELRRQRLFESVPELRARQLQQTVAALDMLAAVIAERLGVPARDMAARTIAGAIVGVALVHLPPGTVGGFQPHDFDRVKESLIGLREHLAEL